MQFWDQLVEVDSLPIHLHDNHPEGQPFYILYKYNLFKMDMARNFKNGCKHRRQK